MKFGGTLSIGKRKSKRPLDTRCPMHLVLKADQEILIEHAELINAVALKFAQKFKIDLYGTAVHFDHVHFNFRPPGRDQYNYWVRAVTGQLSTKIPGLKWRLIPFTRIASWGKGFEDLQNYLQKNRNSAKFFLEAHNQVREFEKKVFEILKI